MRPPKSLLSRAAFHPRAWFAAYFVMFFIVPTIVTLTVTQEAYGIGYLSFFGWQQVFFGALALSILFAITAFAVSSLVPGGQFSDTVQSRTVHSVTRTQMQTGWLMFAIGFGPVLLLGASFGGDRRSDLVVGLEGQILFALSFAFVLGYICVAIGLFERKRFLTFILVTLLFAGFLFVLGGRGRVVWPLISVFCVFEMIRSPILRPFRLAALMLGLFFVGSIMDPLLAIFYGRSVGSLGEIFNLGALFHEVFIARRNFDSFYNFFLIYYYDDLPRSFSYLIEGPRRTFMETYFPAISDRGVGFPATVPGTFWMVGGLAGLSVGSVFFGLLLGLMARIYMRTQNAMWLGFQFYMFTWVLNLGFSLFDNLAKIFAVLALMVPFWLLPKLARSLAPARRLGSDKSATWELG